MDIDTRSSVTETMLEAWQRVDGKAMYVGLGVFLVGTIVLAVKNMLIGDYTFTSWKAVMASGFMLPTMVLLYFGLASFSTRGESFGRWLNAICLIGIPIYFYLRIL